MKFKLYLNYKFKYLNNLNPSTDEWIRDVVSTYRMILFRLKKE